MKIVTAQNTLETLKERLGCGWKEARSICCVSKDNVRLPRCCKTILWYSFIPHSRNFAISCIRLEWAYIAKTITSGFLVGLAEKLKLHSRPGKLHWRTVVMRIGTIVGQSRLVVLLIFKCIFVCRNNYSSICQQSLWYTVLWCCWSVFLAAIHGTVFEWASWFKVE